MIRVHTAIPRLGCMKLGPAKVGASVSGRNSHVDCVSPKACAIIKHIFEVAFVQNCVGEVSQLRALEKYVNGVGFKKNDGDAGSHL